MTAPDPTSRPLLPAIDDLLDRTRSMPDDPNAAGARAALERSLGRPTNRSSRAPSAALRAGGRSAPDRRSGRGFGPSPRQYNRHR